MDSAILRETMVLYIALLSHQKHWQDKHGSVTLWRRNSTTVKSFDITLSEIAMPHMKRRSIILHGMSLICTG